MFVRYVANRAKGKTYRYPQLVESYRKPDGTPAHRVLCTLTQLSETSLANLRKALEAGRKGESVVIAPDAAEVFQSVGVMANLRYLDLAVSYEMWHQLQLDTLLDDILPKSQSNVSAQDLVCALALHRCTDPGSKLAAARWYSKTALPLLQHIPPARFNNTRVHRTLEDLEQVESELQARLAQHLGTSQGAFTALFLDMTDTWFVGRGPQMAYRARTKEGMLRYKVGLALLCDRRGYPVRWQTLPGNYYEADVMGSLVQQISTLEWVHQVPLVLDRMMGKAGVLAQLSQSGVRFVTALPANEFESWTTDVPWQPLADVAVAGTRSSVKDDLARVHAALKRTKMVMCADRWVLDLGVVTRPALSTEAGDGPVAKALRLAVSMQADIDAKVVHNQAELARRMEVSPKCVGIYLKLTKLTPELQRRVLAGEAEVLSMPQLRAIASKQAKQQQASFDALRKKPRQKRNKGCPPQLAKSACEAGPGISIRLVAGFKPEAFVADRRKALDTRREVDAFVEDLNRRLRSKHSRRTEASIQAEVDRFLRSKKWVGLFTVTMKAWTLTRIDPPPAHQN